MNSVQPSFVRPGQKAGLQQHIFSSYTIPTLPSSQPHLATESLRINFSGAITLQELKDINTVNVNIFYINC